MTCRALLVVAGIALALSASARPSQGITREIGPDGLELLVLPIPGARTISLRYVVRAGSRLDPPAKGGVAHLLEHLLLKTRGPDGLELVEAARAAGADINGFTSDESTIYVLDALPQAFPAIAERVLHALTSPALSQADVEREIEVVEREAEYHGPDGGAFQIVSDALFRMAPPSGPILGTGSSRGRITREDLIAFYQGTYSTTATTIVVAGATTAEEVRALLRRSLLLPPALEGEGPRSPTAEPRLPVDERLRAPFIAVVSGYRLEPTDRETCRPLAALLEHRLLMELSVERPLLRSASVSCVMLQGVDFIFALAYTPAIEATEVPDAVRRVFREAGTRPATARERQALERRMSRIYDRILSDPAARADQAASAAATPREGGATQLPSLDHSLRPEAIRALARSRFVRDRSVLMVLSPFEG